MESKAPLDEPLNLKWKILFLSNILLGMLLWFGLSTDYSWSNNWANHIFVWFTGITALTSWLVFAKSSLSHRYKIFIPYLLAPSIGGSLTHLLWLISFLAVVPFVAFHLVNPDLDSSKLIDRIVSPNNDKFIAVYYVGTLDCGYYYDVYLQYFAFPFLRRKISSVNDVKNLSPRDHCFDDDPFSPSHVNTGIEWLDNQTVVLPINNGEMQQISIRPVNFQWPGFHERIFLGYIGFLMIIQGVQRLFLNNEYS